MESIKSRQDVPTDPVLPFAKTFIRLMLPLFLAANTL